MIVSEGFRSNERQNALYAQGRTKPGKIVTNARAGQSNHNTGDAADLCFVVNGQPSFAESNNWNLIGELARQVGLVWGGNFKSIKDRPHVELPAGSVSTEKKN